MSEFLPAAFSTQMSTANSVILFPAVWCVNNKVICAVCLINVRIHTDTHHRSVTHTDRHRQTQTDTDRHRQTQADTDRHRQTQTHTDTHRQTQTTDRQQTAVDHHTFQQSWTDLCTDVVLVTVFSGINADVTQMALSMATCVWTASVSAKYYPGSTSQKPGRSV